MHTLVLDKNSMHHFDAHDLYVLFHPSPPFSAMFPLISLLNPESNLPAGMGTYSVA